MPLSTDALQNFPPKKKEKKEKKIGALTGISGPRSPAAGRGSRQPLLRRPLQRARADDGRGLGAALGVARVDARVEDGGGLEPGHHEAGVGQGKVAHQGVRVVRVELEGEELLEAAVVAGQAGDEDGVGAVVVLRAVGRGLRPTYVRERVKQG